MRLRGTHHYSQELSSVYIFYNNLNTNKNSSNHTLGSESVFQETN